MSDVYDALVGNPASVAGTGQSAEAGTLRVTFRPNFAASTRVNQGANDTLLRLGSADNTFDLDWTGSQATAGVALVNGASSFTLYPRHAAGDRLDLLLSWGRTGAPHLVCNGCGRIAQALQGFTAASGIALENTLGTWSDLFVSQTLDSVRRIYVAIGDSISAEPYASSGSDNGWGRTFGPLVAADGYLLAEGASGRRVEGWTEELTDIAVLDSGATHALVALGVNNLTSGPVDDFATLSGRLATLYARLKGYGVHVTAFTITPIGFSGPVELARLLTNDWIRAKPANVDEVFDAAAVIENPDQTNVPLAEYKAAADFIHPNAAGQVALGQGLAEVLCQVIPSPLAFPLAGRRCR